MTTFQPGQCPALLRKTIVKQVAAALEEDGAGDDLSAAAVPRNATATAQVISRDKGVLAGTFWFDEVFSQIDSEVAVDWHLHDSNAIEKDACLCVVSGNARELLRGERCALNFLQTLSGTATATAEFVRRAPGIAIKDTRKTLPGLRLAQKYAVACGGGTNHRLGLSSAILLKDNHVRACGSVAVAVAKVRQAKPGLAIEVEVSAMAQVREAVAVGVNTILLDNFDTSAIAEAVQVVAGGAEIEASGGVDINNVVRLAQTGVDCISIGALTKHLHALDLSMQFD